MEQLGPWFPECAAPLFWDPEDPFVVGDLNCLWGFIDNISQETVPRRAFLDITDFYGGVLHREEGQLFRLWGHDR